MRKKGKDVRDFLRVMDFPKAIGEVTEKYFQFSVNENDIKFFGEPHNPYDLYNKFCNRDGGLIEFFKDKFFAIHSLPFFDLSSKENSVDSEVNKWNNTTLLKILTKHFDKFNEDNSELLPSTIIWETMTNAQRHGNATKVYSGSFFNRKHKHFTLNYWDDGTNIYQTLINALENNKEIRIPNSDKSNGYKNLHFVVLNNQKAGKFTEGQKYYHSDNTPNITSKNRPVLEKELFIASLFPGISSDVEGKTYRAKQSKQNSGVDEPGNGLAALLNVVIDIFEGEIAIRTGKYFMNIKRPLKTEYKQYEADLENYKSNKLYRVSITDYSASPFEFEGNMITIRLSLK